MPDRTPATPHPRVLHPAAAHGGPVRRPAKTHPAKSKPTLADVGRAAGVSALAASTVLHGARTSSRISDETRQRILTAAARLRYRPGASAPAPANRRMNTIGVAAALHDQELNSYAMEIFTGVLAAAMEHEQSTTMFTLHDWGRDTERLHGWCDGRVDGLILIAPTLSPEAAKLLPAHTPFVSLHSNTVLPNVVNIESDEEHGAFEMVSHLIARGHRRILHVAGDRGLTGAERRIAGFKRALAAANLPFSSALVAPSTFSREGGRKTMRAWLRAHAGEPLPQALFCANDGNALGCLEVFAETGIRVPDDISVAGFDDTLAARTAVPQLTTMRQPLRPMGRRAVEVLLASIAHRNGGPAAEFENPIVFPVELVPRASVAAPPAADRPTPQMSAE